MSTFFKWRTSTLALSLCTVFSLNIHASEAVVEPEQVYPFMSPELTPAQALTGKHTVGVRTMDITNPNQLNPLTGKTADRTLTLELWYPAQDAPTQALAHYDNVTRLHHPFSVQGTAYRDAPVLDSKEKMPLVVISHGYTGYRTLMFYLGEHLASHGYIVAAIDHTDSVNADVDMINAPFTGFPSTLFNRSRDQQFTLNQLTSGKHFLSAHIDQERAGLIGYSMGGYGAVNTVGGCYDFKAPSISALTGVTDAQQIEVIARAFNSCAGGQYENPKVDPRWRAAIAIAPWGNQHSLFNRDAMSKITTPLLYMAGEFDDVSHYPSIQQLFADTQGEHTYMLTYRNARHTIASHPIPSVAREQEKDFGHYMEFTWNTQWLNAINKHFALSMMDCHIKGENKACEFLDLEGDSHQWGDLGEKIEPWVGFPSRYSNGMSWDHK